MSRREPLLLVQDMIEAIEAIEVYSREMEIRFFDILDEFVDGNKDVKEPQVPSPVRQNSVRNGCSV